MSFWFHANFRCSKARKKICRFWNNYIFDMNFDTCCDLWRCHLNSSRKFSTTFVVGKIVDVFNKQKKLWNYFLICWKVRMKCVSHHFDQLVKTDWGGAIGIEFVDCCLYCALCCAVSLHDDESSSYDDDDDDGNSVCDAVMCLSLLCQRSQMPHWDERMASLSHSLSSISAVGSRLYIHSDRHGYQRDTVCITYVSTQTPGNLNAALNIFLF